MTTVAAPARPASAELPREIETVIIGAGFSGLAVAHGMMKAGNHDFVILDRGGSAGGTWRDNTYPGCGCDVPSHLYSFSFALNPEWTNTFSKQPEIWEYMRDVSARFGLDERTCWETSVEAAEWDADAQRWRVQTSKGPVSARFVVESSGRLSEPSIPDIPGLDSFAGPYFHSAQWDHDVDLTGKRVAVIGTGASAIQFIPEIQPEVAQLDVYQRTAPWVWHSRRRPITRLERAIYRHVPFAQRLMRNALYWAREVFALPMLRHPFLARGLRRQATRIINRHIKDPELRAKVTPDYAVGCKRILPSDNYYPALAKDNVDVLTDGIAEVRAGSIVDRSGTDRSYDVIILGTGFKVTALPIGEKIKGIGGRTIAEAFAGTPRAYKGTTVLGFPNVFMGLGPNTGLGHNSALLMAEGQVPYIVDAIERARRDGIGAWHVKPEVERAYNEDLQRAMRPTVWASGGCDSWYKDENGVVSTLWPYFVPRYRRELRRFDPAAYRAEPLRPPAADAAAAERGGEDLEPALA